MKQRTHRQQNNGVVQGVYNDGAVGSVFPGGAVITSPAARDVDRNASIVIDSIDL